MTDNRGFLQLLHDYGLSKYNPSKGHGCKEVEVVEEIQKVGYDSIPLDKAIFQEDEVITIKTEEGKVFDFDFKRFEDKFYDKSNITIILGGRGQGKTVEGFHALENVRARTKKNIYALGFPNVVLPDYVIKIDDMEQVLPESFVLIDEAGIQFNAKATFNEKAKYLANALRIARHNDISLIAITQNSASLDINIIRMTDTIIFKKPSLLQEFFERTPIKKLYGDALVYLNTVKGKEYCYIFDNDFCGLVKTPLPTFWNENVSKAFGLGASK